MYKIETLNNKRGWKSDIARHLYKTPASISRIFREGVKSRRIKLDITKAYNTIFNTKYSADELFSEVE